MRFLTHRRKRILAWTIDLPVVDVAMMEVAVEANRPVEDPNAVIVIQNDVSRPVKGVVNRQSPNPVHGDFRGMKLDEKSRAGHDDRRVRNPDRPGVSING